jgi:hypothetical protein
MKRSLPWLLPFLVAVLGLTAIDVPPGPIVKYCGYFALAIALPGTLLLRAAWRSTGNWAEDLGLGSVVGATWQLIGWAANTWCRPVGKQTPGCDARGYIVSGIAGRRTLIEGWAYTNPAMAEQGVGGRRYTEQPSPWPERVALTNEAITAPTPDVLRRLREDYHVRWLYADGYDGTVSPALGQLAVLRHSVGKVRIYDLGE